MSELEKVLEIALDEVGYLEKKTNAQLDSKKANAGRNNYTKYARDLDNIKDFYNGKKNGYAWCCVFVAWCFNKAVGTDRARELLCYPKKSLGAGCKYAMNYYKKQNKFFTSPKKGDQVFFRVGHTGIVYNVDSNYIYTVEGNTSNSSEVVANGGCVAKKKYKIGSSSISGYGRPAYKVEAISEDKNHPFKTGECYAYYKLLYAKCVRKTHSLGNNIKRVKDVSKVLQRCLVNKFSWQEAKIKKGILITILEIYIDSNGLTWGRNYDGWVVLCEKDGTKQAEFVRNR